MRLALGGTGTGSPGIRFLPRLLRDLSDEGARMEFHTQLAEGVRRHPDGGHVCMGDLSGLGSPFGCRDTLEGIGSWFLWASSSFLASLLSHHWLQHLDRT